MVKNIRPIWILIYFDWFLSSFKVYFAFNHNFNLIFFSYYKHNVLSAKDG